MAVDYEPFSNLVPLGERVVYLEGIEEGDQIDFIEILGKPATGIQITTSSSSDEVTYRINNKLRRQVLSERAGLYPPHHQRMFTEEFAYWEPGFPSFTSTGALIEFVFNKTSSLEIVSLTLDSGSTIDIVAW